MAPGPPWGVVRYMDTLRPCSTFRRGTPAAWTVAGCVGLREMT